MSRVLSLFFVLLVLSVGSAAQGASAPAASSAAVVNEVEVTGVKFNSVRPPNGAPGTWLEAAAVLDVKPAGSLAGRMVSRIRVSLTLGFELPAPPGGERRMEFYRTEAECVALETGRADVRFYLPPELVKRDQLHGDAKYWGVEITVAGRALPAGKGNYPAALASAELRKSFQSRAVNAAAANEGLLLPQYLTPFALDYPRSTPSFVRREPR